MKRGSKVIATPEEVGDSLNRLRASTVDALSRIPRAAALKELIDLWTDFALRSLTQVIFYLGLRGTVLHRLRMHSLYLNEDFVSADDKDVGPDLRFRLLPKFSLVREALHVYQLGLAELSPALDRLAIAHPHLPSAQTFGTNSAAFFQLIPHPQTADRVVRTPVDRQELICVHKRFFDDRELNLGRHFLVSQLLLRQAPRHLPRVLTGHASRGVEVSGDASLIPPRMAVLELGDELESIFRDCGVVGSPAVPSRLSPPLVGRLPTINDRFLEPRMDELYRILPPAFDQFTLTALAFTEETRKDLLEGAGPSSRGARIALSLGAFSGLAEYDIETLWPGLGSSVLAAPSPIAIWKRPEAMEISQPLGPATTLVMAANDFGNLNEGWGQVRDAIASWVRKRFPSLRWPIEDDRVVKIAFALISRYVRFHCPPAALAAASGAVAAATFNRGSLLRIAQGPNLATPNVGPVPLPFPGGHRRAGNGVLNDVAHVAHEAGDTRRPLGREVARSTHARRGLDEIRFDGHRPAAALAAYLRREAQSIEQAEQGKLEWSSISTYVSEIMVGLVTVRPYEDPAKWSEEEWVSFADATRDRIDEQRTVKQGKYDGLNRFLKVGASLGWEIPPHLFASVRDGKAKFRVTAASAAVLAEDADAIRMDVAAQFADHPLLNRAAEAAVEQFIALGPRQGELFAATTDCIDQLVGAVIFQHGAHSKQKGDNACRAVEASGSSLALIRQLAVLRQEDGSPYLFLDATGSDWSIADAIETALSDALQRRIGWGRIHSFRPAAAMRELLPGWESLARALLQGRLSPRDSLAWIATLVKNGFCALGPALHRIGHGSAGTLIVYYMAPWPFVLAAAMQATLVDVAPSRSLILKALGSDDAFRQARSRGKAEFEPWSYLEKAAAKNLGLPSMGTTSDSPVPKPADQRQISPRPSVEAIAKCVRAVLAGMPIVVAAHRHGILQSTVRLIEEALAMHDVRRIAERQRGAARPGSIAADKSGLDSECAADLLMAALISPADRLENLLADLQGNAPNRRLLPAGQMEARLSAHLGCLPPGLGIVVRFSKLDTAESSQLVDFYPRIAVGKELRYGRPIVQIRALSDPGNSVLMGRLTVLARMSAMAVLVAQTVYSK